MGGGGRSPCCDKNKVKKGPWSPAEDVRLVSFIQKHGHHNWRSLPKQAGLLRCGKSCRLRWINYLRPDLKRGNFTPQEEDSIIRLHATFGNKWSKIASKLPGRTDNEIKNVWNTHLKKRSKTFAANCNISIDHGNNQKEISSNHQDVQKVFEGGEGGGGGGALLVEDIAQPSTASSTVSWSMFEDIKLIQPQIDQNHDHDHVPTESIDVDYYWMRLLEEELGLVDATSATNQQIDHQKNDLTKLDDEQTSYNTEMWCKISDEIYSLL